MPLLDVKKSYMGFRGSSFRNRPKTLKPVPNAIGRVIPRVGQKEAGMVLLSGHSRPSGEI